MSENKIEGEKEVDVARIRAAILENHLTDEKVAESIGCAVGTLHNKLAGAGAWTLSDILKISAVTKHDVDYFLK